MTTRSRMLSLLSVAAIALMSLAGRGLAEDSRPSEGLAPATQPDRAVAQAVEARRGKTELSRLAASMKAGAWAELKTEMPKGLWSAPPPGRGLHIAGWTDDAHWDSRTGQLFYLGMRQTRKFIAYSEQTNAWRAIPLPKDHKAAGSPHLENKWGHIYGNNAFDPDRSRFYHMYHGGPGIEVTDSQPGGTSYFEVVSEKWTYVTGGAVMTGCIEYFSARRGLVALAGGNVRFFSEQTKAWEDLGKVAVCGYHSLARHNPFRQEVLMAGGNHSPRTVVRLKRDGRFEQLKDCPVDLSTGSDKITVDPLSGRYLIMRTGEKKLFEFDSEKNEYRLVDDFTTTPWPFPHYDMPVVAFIPEYGVTVWAGSKVFLYKHNPAAAREQPATMPQKAPGDL